MSERACGVHCLDAAIHDECPYCTRMRIEERDAEIKRLRKRVAELEASVIRIPMIDPVWIRSDTDTHWVLVFATQGQADAEYEGQVNTLKEPSDD